MLQRATLLALLATLTLAATLVSARSVRVTSEDLHRGGGVPPGWKFTTPAGDPAKGKEVFAALECYTCHEVEGGGFPPKADDKSGPRLSRMGAFHPAEYFAESILDPNAVVIDAPGFFGADGRSTMPSYGDVLTLQQWIDLVAYLKSLGGDGGHAGHAAGGTTVEGGHGGHGGDGGHAGHEADDGKTVGEYRVRLDFTEPAQEGRPGYLMVTIADAASDHPVPYLPVRARIGSGAGARTVTLAPVLGAQGLHYGASVRIPDETESVMVLIGAATAKVTGVEKGRYRTPRQVPFER
jgi:mono/diheme cytochrome c family protein